MAAVCKAFFSGATLADWRDGYRTGSFLLSSLLEAFGTGVDNAGRNDPAWITRLDEARLNVQLRDLTAWLEAAGGDSTKLPLYGIPFAVKDNIDVAGWPTTAGCPQFSYVAREDATVVHRLRQAGAIVIGKTNLDQFATGLAGVRSPYGVVPNTFRPEYICGGSSSGSSSVVARGIVPFALGTDTAGSGRVPAGMNNIVGLKPTRGWLSVTGVVPACRTLDCVSVLALTVEDAEWVAHIAAGFDPADDYSRVPSPSAPAALPDRPRFGVPQEPEFFGDGEAAAMYERALAMARRIGAELVRIDFSPFLELSALLYEGSWVAERLVTLEPLLRRDPGAVHPAVRAVVEQAANFSAADTFRAEYQRARLTGLVKKVMDDLDGLLVPSAPTAFTIDQVLADPIALNAKLGIYSSFANFADLCALALPAGIRADGLPAGITLLARAWHDRALAGFGLQWQQCLSAVTPDVALGATGQRYSAPRHGSRPPAANTIRIAVVGAHLKGMPLNHQLTSRGAAFVEATETAGDYRLFALAGSLPPKPGLVRAAAQERGASIELELWDVPTALFGSFTAEVPPPLAIGNVILRDGRMVKGFLCEQYGLTDAREITSFGSWRAYLAHMKHEHCVLGGASIFSTILIANRGEIAVRAMRTLRRMGIESVAVYADADGDALHVRTADRAISLGGGGPAENYLRVDKMIDACRVSGAQAVFPGYGFLSENAEFAEACDAAGITFIGPTPSHIRAFGLKHRSRQLAAEAGVPVLPGTPLLSLLDDALLAAEQLGYPLMLKSTAGGGGIGLARCDTPQDLAAAYERTRRLGLQFFTDGGVFLERSIDHARHIEVQIFGDGEGKVIALGERDCSIQRRYQKVLEETPAPHLDDRTRAALLDAAVRLGKAVHYRSAGTVEFLYDTAGQNFYFLEVNTRLQVEHPVTEMVTGHDLVECMVNLAAGEPLDWDALQQKPVGVAMEVRLYAEDPARNFQPSPGVLTEVHFPESARVDGWVETGTAVSPYYDGLLAKLSVHGATRDQARARLAAALDETRLHGIETNVEWLRQIVSSRSFCDGKLTTRFLDGFAFHALAIEVVEPGTYTTVQDFPGRTGYWDVGVPPSGPMDDYAFRLANRIVGNPSHAAGMECTLAGPALRFHHDAIIAVTGARTAATLNGDAVAMWAPVQVRAGQVLTVGDATSGCRTYIAVRNGLDVPVYLGSRSTFVLGQFGGHAGRPLRAGDMVRIANPRLAGDVSAPLDDPCTVPAELIPSYSSHWQIGVLHGPHGAPDYFTRESMDLFFSTDWEVHHNSNRLGVRLIGPKPVWARDNGGEAGLHPSNVHDCEYALGSVNFTGDQPVILTRDGPSLGGFVCPATIIKAELWKIGQVKPGDRIRFIPLPYEDALTLEHALERGIRTLEPVPSVPMFPALQPRPAAASAALLAERAADGHHPRARWRQAGDSYILLEYGEDVLDLALRLRVHLLVEAIRAENLPIEELSPGVRSLQIRYHSSRMRQPELMRHLLRMEEALPDTAGLKIPTRIVHLPIAFDDSATRGAIARYRETVRGDAPWLPNNLEFLRRVNGLQTIAEVQQTIQAARYMVLGLGDVYLGAPCAVPVDPRHRLLSSKYNPARNFTAEGTVGIGGMYMCIYGMDSPGGYQLVGRTLPIWNRHLKNTQFEAGKPWLLRFFDQITFHPVDEPELTRQREAFRTGRNPIRMEQEVFDYGEYLRFLDQHRLDIAAFRARQQHSFAAEIARWKDQEAVVATKPGPLPMVVEEAVPAGHRLLAPMHGSIWKLLAKPGERVEASQAILIVEAMKMELVISTPTSGVVKAICCTVGHSVAMGDVLAVIET